MAEGGWRKRKVLFFILFTLSLVFIGIYLQYKVNIMAAPAVLRTQLARVTGIGKSEEENGIGKSVKENGGVQTAVKKAKPRSKIRTKQNSRDEENGGGHIPLTNGKQLFEKKGSNNGLLPDNERDNTINDHNLKKVSIKKHRLTAAVNEISKLLNRLAPRTTVSTRKHASIISNNLVLKKGEFKRRYPQAIIAGVKKGGTRALLSFLGKHPYVRSGGKEMHFFDKNDRYERGLKFYLRQMPYSFANEITIEKTPGYFVKPSVPRRICNFSKNVKLIFIFRNPVERAISDFAQALSKDGKEGKRFESLVFKKSKPRVVDRSNSKVSIGLYALHLKRWLKYFPLKQMYFVDGDSFIRNPVPEIINVQKYLDLPVLIDENSFYFNETKGFYCILVSRNGGGNVTSDCLGSSKGRKHPFIRQGTIDRLTDFYRPHNRELFAMINKDFDWPV